MKSKDIPPRKPKLKRDSDSQSRTSESIRARHLTRITTLADVTCWTHGTLAQGTFERTHDWPRNDRASNPGHAVEKCHRCRDLDPPTGLDCTNGKAGEHKYGKERDQGSNLAQLLARKDVGKAYCQVIHAPQCGQGFWRYVTDFLQTGHLGRRASNSAKPPRPNRIPPTTSPQSTSLAMLFLARLAGTWAQRLKRNPPRRRERLVGLRLASQDRAHASSGATAAAPYYGAT